MVSSVLAVDPHIKTNRTVDFRTVDSILDSLIDEGMSDEEKVLKVFHTIRRMFVHGPTPRALAYDFHRVLHVLGTGACLSMTTPLHLLYERLGYASQSWVHDGHHMMQVYYGDGWHCLDPHMNFYCYDRSTPPQIASIRQLREDPSLARDAVAEGRAGRGYLLCGDKPDWFAGEHGVWYLEADGEWPEMKVEEPFGRIALRRGESYIRTWHPGEHFYRDAWIPRDGTGPIHHCAEADRRDEANWDLYEPHAWSGRPGQDRIYYRAWGVGRLVYRPRFEDGSYIDGVLSRENVTVDQRDGTAMLVQGDVGMPGEVVFTVSCPYVLTAGELRLSSEGAGGIDAWVEVEEGIPLSDESGRNAPADKCTPLSLVADGEGMRARFVDEINGCFEGYRLRVRLLEGASLKALELVSHFQLNRYSLPHLVPGKNVISVEAGVFGSPLTVGYEWSEGPGWKEPQSEQRTFSASGAFEIDVTGPKYPRMEALSLTV
jgi:hypothetical protein